MSIDPSAAAPAAAVRKAKRGSAAAAIQTLATSPDEARAAAEHDAIMAGLAGHVSAPRLPLPYRLGLLLVAGTMLLLPAIYVALIALVGWVVWLHATHDTSVFQLMGQGHGRGALAIAMMVLVAYFGPIIVGGLLVLFMVKPLFSRKRESTQTLVLARQEQPTLFEFVDRLARHVGAPAPRAIEVDCDVNAHARFRRGLISAISGDGDLVLRIGLPLANNLPLRNFAGVLAHEFGHFAQRGGMTLTYVIRSMSHWFARVVYERDAWDDRLDATARDGGWWPITVVANVARLFVWLSRRVLWLLMMIGHAIASLMLRQMEYDADRYETLLAGSKEFERTGRSLKSIGLASQWAYDAVGAAWNDRRLPDDLPALIAQQHAKIEPDTLKKLASLVNDSKTGWLDTHPADRDRIAAAQRLAQPGTFTIDRPATAVFNDFAGLSRRATLARYFELLGNQVKPENLVPVERVIEQDEQKSDRFKSLARYTQGVVHVVAMAAPTTLPPVPADVDGATMRLLELRNELLDLAPAARTAIESLAEADGKRTRVGQVKALHLAGIAKVPAKAFGFKKADAGELASETSAAERLQQAADPAVRAAHAAAMERLTIALSLEPMTLEPATRASSDVPTVAQALSVDESETYDVAGPAGEYVVAAPADADSTGGLVATIARLHAARDEAERIADECTRLHVLLACIKGETRDETLVGAILSRSRNVADALTTLRDALPTSAYPYDHAERAAMTVRSFVIGKDPIPPREEPFAVLNAGQGATSRFLDLYGRVLSDLVHRAEAVESHLGLAPMALPGAA